MAKITVTDVTNFISGTALSALSRLGLSPDIVNEQAVWRAYLCSDCLAKGRCSYTLPDGRPGGCGCSTPSMFFAPNKVDSRGRWSKMLPKDKWEEFTRSEQYKRAISTEKYARVRDKVLRNGS